MKGPAVFLAQFMGDAAPFDTLPSAARWMADAGYVGVQIPTWDKPPASTWTLRGGEPGLLRRTGRHLPRGGASRLPSCRRICRGNWSRCTRPMTWQFDALCARCMLNGKPAERQAMGGRATPSGRQGEPAAGAQRACDLFRRARLALSLSLAAAAGRTGRGSVRRAGASRWRPILDAFRRTGRRCRLRNPSGRGPARWRDVRACSWRGVGQSSARQHPLRPQPLSCCRQLDYLSVHRHLSRAHPDASTSRMPSSIRTGAQGVYGGFQELGGSPRPLPFAR
jgi:hypothetical protein